jgi:DNA-binding SARP family transcriptional activator
VNFAILGTLEVACDDRPVELRRAKPRALLAMLLLHPNQVVSVDRLIDGLWGDYPPASAANTLQGYVSHVRRVLHDDPGSGPRPELRTQSPGYVLAVAPEQVDACQFERLVDEGRRALASRRPERAAYLLDQALSLWRGPALVDFAGQPFARSETARLEELRLEATEAHADAELDLGHHQQLVGQLQVLVSQHPLRERSWGQLMVALYRCGRQGEALRAFQDARRILGDELGIHPSPTLRRLEADILAQADELDWHEPSSRSAASDISRSGSAAADRLLIGREREMTRLDTALEQAGRGSGEVLLVLGEPGVGKTRLVEELAIHARSAEAHLAWGRCYEGQGAAAFWPWTQIITALFDQGDPETLRAALGVGAGDIALIVPEVKELVPGVELPPVIDGDAARTRLYDAVSRFFMRLAWHAPLVLAIEDIHWADLPSLQLLGVLASRAHEAGILIVATFRDVDPLITGPLADALAGLARYPGVSHLALSGLGPTEVGRFLTELTATVPSPQLVTEVHDRTEGNPFFVSELARLSSQDGSGEGSLASSAQIPIGVRDVIRRRVARLPEATGQLLAAAAVVGREFDLDVLFALSGDDHDTTLDLLEPALQARLIIESEEARTSYRFSHALVNETIYDQSTPIGRARLHRRVGEALEQVHQHDDSAHVVELAHHFYQAARTGAADKALGYALRAAEVAEARLAYEQAEEQLGRAVELVRRTSADERASRELDIQVRLFLLLMRRGYTSPAVGRASARARELSRMVQIPRQVEASLTGVAVFSAVSSDYETALACGEELMALGERSGTPMLQLSGSTWLGLVGFLRGELDIAHDHNERALAIGSTIDSRSIVSPRGVDPLSLARHFAATVEWLRGEPERACALIAEGIELANRPDAEFTLANALLIDAMLGVFAGDVDWALAGANRAIELSERFGFRMYQAFAGVVRGWARARSGEMASGEAEMEAWFAVTQELRATCLRPFHLGLLADARRATGSLDAALGTIEQAIGYTDHGGDLFWEAELHRLRGETLMAMADGRPDDDLGRTGDEQASSDAERSLRRAVTIAHRQGAVALEARAQASLSLARSLAPKG